MGGDRYAQNFSPNRADKPEVTSVFADLRDDFLVGYRLNTARAYWGDLEHLADWLAAMDRTVNQLTNPLLFRYLLSLRLRGYGASTVRRRITCLRAFVAHLHGVGVSIEVDVDRVAAQLRNSSDAAGATSLLLVSDDELVRVGTRACLSTAGLVDCVDFRLAELDDAAALLPRQDYALLHLTPRQAPDRWAAVSLLHFISQGIVATATVVMTSVDVPALVRLRLAEAGCDFVFPYAVVAEDPHAFAAALRIGELDEAFRLPTQWAIRESLGLRWDGAVEPYLEAARALPPAIWTSHRPQSALPIERTELRRVQRLARDVAGLPEPDFRRYASSLRRPPELPELSRVRAFTRGLLGLI